MLVTKVEYFIYALFGEALDILITAFPKILTVFFTNTKAARIQTMQALQSSDYAFTSTLNNHAT